MRHPVDETGYGYICTGDAVAQVAVTAVSIRSVQQFTKSHNRPRHRVRSDGNYAWNTEISVTSDRRCLHSLSLALTDTVSQCFQQLRSEMISERNLLWTMRFVRQHIEPIDTAGQIAEVVHPAGQYTLEL